MAARCSPSSSVPAASAWVRSVSVPTQTPANVLSNDTQRGLEWQPTVPTRATREADAWNMHAAAAAVHGAWLAPAAHGIQRVDAALRARWTPRPRGAGQLPQPG